MTDVHLLYLGNRKYFACMCVCMSIEVKWVREAKRERERERERERAREREGGPLTHSPQAADEVCTQSARCTGTLHEFTLNPPHSPSPLGHVAMFRAASQPADLLWVILLSLLLVPESGCRGAGADSCHEVKTAYMMRQIGPVELVPDSPGTGRSLWRYHMITESVENMILRHL